MKALFIISGCVLAAAAAPAQADVLFDNFGPGDSYRLDMGQTLAFGGPLGGVSYEAAAPFTVTGGDFFFDSAEVPIMHFWGPDLVYADIRSDVGGAPGAVLETTTGSGVTVPDEWAPPIELAFSGSLLLEEGKTYWLALRTEATDAFLAWNLTTEDDFGLRAWRIDGAEWQTGVGTPGNDEQRQAFRINGTAVPAPGAMALLAVAGLARRRRR